MALVERASGGRDRRAGDGDVGAKFRHQRAQINAVTVGGTVVSVLAAVLLLGTGHLFLGACAVVKVSIRHARRRAEV